MAKKWIERVEERERIRDAAPALLEALEALVNEDAPASCCDAGVKARAAIAQAKGESK